VPRLPPLPQPAPLPPPSLPVVPEASKLNTAPELTKISLPDQSESGREPLAVTMSEEMKLSPPRKRNCCTPPTTEDCTFTPKKLVVSMPLMVITPVSVLKLIASARISLAETKKYRQIAQHNSR